jgi:hypothetical protein
MLSLRRMMNFSISTAQKITELKAMLSKISSAVNAWVLKKAPRNGT